VRDCQARRTDFHPSAMSVPTHTEETSSDRIIDRASFIGVLVGCVAYGGFMASFKQTRTHLLYQASTLYLQSPVFAPSEGHSLSPTTHGARMSLLHMWSYSSP
jgi:hypothetical protein